MDNRRIDAVKKKLRGPRLSALAAADLLEELYGDGTDEALCDEALGELSHMRDKSAWKDSKVLHLILARDAPPSQRLDAVIFQLRFVPKAPTG